MAAVVDGSTATVTYNDGMWTPEDQIATPTLATSPPAAATTTLESTLTDDQDLTETGTVEDEATTTTTPAAVIPATSSMTTTTTTPVAQQTTSPFVVVTTSSSSSTPAAQNTVSAQIDSTVAPLSNTLVSSASVPSSSASARQTIVGSFAPATDTSKATDAKETHDGVDMKLLIPAFVVGPIVIVLMILALSHGRWWGKKNRSSSSSSSCFGRRNGRARKRRLNKSLPHPPRKDMFADEDMYDDEPQQDKLSFGYDRAQFERQELGGAAATRRYSGQDDEVDYVDDEGLDPWDEKAAMGPYAQREAQPQHESRWTQLKRGLSNASTRFRRGRSQRQAQRSRQNMMEAPFAPPTTSSVYNLPSIDIRGHDNGSAWNYGTRPEATIFEEQYRNEQQGTLTAPGAWGWGTKGVSRQSSIASRISDKIFGNRNGNLLVPPSPSIYSPVMRSTEAYSGLDGQDIDEEPDHEALDAYLAEARVGNDQLASRYLGGETELAYAAIASPQSRYDSVNRQDEYRARDDYRTRHESASNSNHRVVYDDLVQQMGMTMPTPPRFTHSSPTKASTGAALLRNNNQSIPDSPLRKEVRPGMIFQYDSPVGQSTYQPPPPPSQDLMSLSPERATPSSPRPPLPLPPQGQQQQTSPRQPMFASAYRDVAAATAARPNPQLAGERDVFDSPLSKVPYVQDSLMSLDGSVVFGGVDTDEFARRQTQHVQDGSMTPPAVPPRNPMRRVTPPRHAVDNARDEVQRPPLPTTSRVKNAVSTIQNRSSSPKRSTRATSSHARTKSQDLSTKVTGATTTYSRPTKTLSAEDELEDVNERNVRLTRRKEQAQNEEISDMLIERRRTAEWSSFDFDQEHRRRHQSDGQEQRDRPLSADSKRLSAMLRKPSQGSGLGKE
ncbi:hypothetical protein OIO90_000970 [Microbotryomycetes sp. JL221]|nr:hypothetical protein OIO90_000970 [Microbotryomycetes sp. JL221]